MALILKTDFTEYIQFTNNVPDRLVDFHLKKAEELDFKPLLPTELWDKIKEVSPGMGAELSEFFTDYCKPVIIHFTILRFLVEAGRNITQFGLIVPFEPTSTPASDKSRAEVRNSYKKDLDSYLNLFYAQLKEVSYTFDSTVYSFDSDACKTFKRNNLTIRAI